ncbi:MAG: IPExxxVDY family protein [Apibacter sp.]|nr:IPExxxVDY family protein [Apibacter sp.]
MSVLKTYSLDWEIDDPVFDFNLLGFKSYINKDYDFVFYLNKNCNLNFKRVNDQQIIEDGITYIFSIYRFFHEKTKQKIELISNISYPQPIYENDSFFDEVEKIKILIPEYKYFNYFLKSDFLLDEEFYINLGNLKNIYKFSEINIDKIKIRNLENLILPT